MSGIITFAQCLARPSNNGIDYWLNDHLIGVKEYIDNRLAWADPLICKLAGLAGICHDIAKAHIDWQMYVRKKRPDGPNHAPAGAFLFSYLGYSLLKNENAWPGNASIWLWLIRDIADHHGTLKSIEENRWIGAGAWGKVDLQGVEEFIHSLYPELRNIDITRNKLSDWAECVYDVYEEALEMLDLGYSYVAPLELMKRLSVWRELTTALIAGDRFHISPTNTVWLDEQAHRHNQESLNQYCLSNDSVMAPIRKEAQKAILEQLVDNPNQRIYTVEMPTGYGKTITALAIASWLGINHGYRKIIYVAPYLSILEQTSKVIEEVLNSSALEHHSLAIIESDNHYEREISSGQLMMESWAHSIVCTSFQQWSKALFPNRAQDVLRRAYLHKSVIIIDEPQIFAPEGWNVFLCGLEAITDIYDLKVVFLSATMPPYDYGLSIPPNRLTVKPTKTIERYQVVQAGEMDEQRLADYLVCQNERCQAAILNTIGDAYLVYKELSRRKTPNLRLLHGMMVPLHKRIEIEKIKDIQEKGESLCLVSTQIIEAGVDLTFGHIVRALSILPSIAQAAGRVNRHFEKELGLLSLILFLRAGKRDTRRYVYPSSLLKLTDQLLSQKKIWIESEINNLIKVYYKKMFEYNSFEAGKQAIADAYEGDWPNLSSFKPFGEDYLKLPVFVPWKACPEYEKYLPPKFVELQNRLGIYSPESLYQHYADRNYYSKQSFEKKKEFMILFNHYVVNVPAKLAVSIVDKELYMENRIPILLNLEDYDLNTGLAKRFMEGFDNII